MLYCWSSIIVFDMVWFIGFIYFDVWKFVLWLIILVKVYDVKLNVINDVKLVVNVDVDGLVVVILR